MRRKKHILGQMMAQVKTGLSTMQLYQGQHKMCDEDNLEIMSKVTKIKCTIKTGFILGPNIMLSGENACIN